MQVENWRVCSYRLFRAIQEWALRRNFFFVKEHLGIAAQRLADLLISLLQTSYDLPSAVYLNDEILMNPAFFAQVFSLVERRGYSREEKKSTV